MKAVSSRLSVSIRHGLAAMALVMVAGSGHAQTIDFRTNFPNYPLMTGGEAVPPNILLILDDSGSMAYQRIRLDGSGENSNGLTDTVRERSSVNNLLFYNPDKTYLPWRNHEMNSTGRLSQADFTAVRTSTAYATSGGFMNLEGSESSRAEAVVYYPKPGVVNPGNTTSNYYRYYLNQVAGREEYVFGRDLRDGGVYSVRSGISLSATGSSNRSNSDWFNLPTGVGGYAFRSGDSLTVSAGGLGSYPDNFDLIVSRDGVNICSSGHSCEISSYQSGSVYRARLTVVGRSSNRTASTTSGRIELSYGPYFVEETPTGRSQLEEKQNFANWYTYHRTRSKMAKAGAAEAFGRLGKNYRVAYDSIWNRNGNKTSYTPNTSGSYPSLRIGDGRSGDGLFIDTNRENFFDALFAANASGNTPLRGALQRAGRYFSQVEPYKDATDSQISCRQNYSILTTDGYWNDNSGFTANGIGNADGVSTNPYRDGLANTLADVAYKYWATDLRPGTPAQGGLANNVRPTATNPNTHQHMVTFGVSLGLSGLLNTNNAPPTPWTIDPINNSGAARIDDLWHAALNSKGDFFIASDTDRFASALESALRTIDARSASGSNISSSSTKTESTTLTFVAGFTSGSWIGELSASPFNAALTGVSNTALWRLSQTFSASGVNRPAFFRTRPVVTSLTNGVAKNFNSEMADAGSFARAGITAGENIAYIRGDQSGEVGVDGTALRKRAYPFGDIVDSSPAFVADSDSLYIGANDGMLHGINATTGKVLFSYIPKGVDVTALKSLSSPDYEHRYFVDGQIDVSRRTMTAGRNILVGALGRGGRGVFSLDVTDPAAFAPSKVLWDRSTQDRVTDRDMGYVFGSVRIREGNGDKVYAFVPNGIDSPNGSAALYVYDITTPGSPQPYALVADNGGQNGLMSLGLSDLNNDGKVDYVYGGDLKGNVWRWDFTGNSVPTTATKLFQAVGPDGTPQSITGGIAVGKSPRGDIYLGFGTGRFISNSDVPSSDTDGTVQSIYGLIDGAQSITGRDKLTARTIKYSGTLDGGGDANGFDDYAELPASSRGWYIDLPVPERVTSAPTVYGTAMYLTSIVPANSSDCTGASGHGYLNAINMFTGTAAKEGGYFKIGGNMGGGTVGRIKVSGGLPTEVNLTMGLATLGTGSNTGSGDDTFGAPIPPPTGALPRRVSWREIVQ